MHTVTRLKSANGKTATTTGPEGVMIPIGIPVSAMISIDISVVQQASLWEVVPTLSQLTRTHFVISEQRGFTVIASAAPILTTQISITVTVVLVVTDYVMVKQETRNRHHR